MAIQNIPTQTEPLDSANLYYLYGDATATTADIEVYLSPFATGLEPDLPSDAGEVMYLSSTDANDVGGVVIVTGLDTQFRYVRYFIPTNGLSLVPTPPMTRVNNMFWFSASKQLGDVTLTDNPATKVFRGIKLGERDSDALISLPKNCRFKVQQTYSEMIRDSNQQSSVKVKYYFKFPGSDWTLSFKQGLALQGSSSNVYTDVAPVELPGPVDIYATCESTNVDVEVLTRGTISIKVA